MTEPIKTILFRVSHLPGCQDCIKREASKILRDELISMGYLFPQRPYNVSGAVGTAAHAGITEYLRGYKTGVASVSAAVDCGVAEFDAELLRKVVEFDATTINNDSAEKQIKSMVNTFVFGILPFIESEPEDLIIEQKEPYQATVTPTIIGGVGYKFTLSGHPDLIESKLNKIHDFKTGMSAETCHAQLGGYVLLAKALGLTAPETCVIDHLPRKKPTKEEPNRWCGEPNIYSYEAGLCEQEARATFSQACYQIARFLSSGDISMLSHNPSSNLCSAKYCPAHGTDFCPVSKTFKN